jgi:Family of unknown function (DUF6069)
MPSPSTEPMSPPALGAALTATVATPTTRRIGRLLRTGVLAGVAASAVAIAIAAAARAADVALEMDDKTIALAAFALQTLLATAAGVLLAAVVRRRRPFLAITLASTALSLIPLMTAPDDTATSIVLVATHLFAAAIVIPALGRQLAAR